MNKMKRVLILASVVIVASVLYLWGHSDGSEGRAPMLTEKSLATESSPKVSVKEREMDVYYPGTEELKPDEMRVVACGTGMASPRPKQAAACWLIELGNGDKFLFDIGAGSHERIAAQKIPYDYIDKVFIGHLHVDHFGDLGSFWLGGTTMNRLTPLRIWGPSGSKEELGTKYMVDHMTKMYSWDYASRLGNVNTQGFQTDVTEFDYKAVNKVIYNENGVAIRTIPAIHALDGSVSFVMEWNGLKFFFSSDTYPNNWELEYAKDCDLAVRRAGRCRYCLHGNRFIDARLRGCGYSTWHTY